MAGTATASAIPITLTFNLQQAGSSGSVFTFGANEDPFLTIDVTALTGGGAALVTRNGTDGLGVDGGTFLDQSDLDGFNGVEALIFTPNFTVTNGRVLSISFTKIDTTLDDDEAQIFLDGVSQFNGPLSTTVSGGSFSSTAFVGDIRVQSTDLNDNFSIRQLQIEVEAVPEPGALSLFGLGLLGAAYLGRRRRGNT